MQVQITQNNANNPIIASKSALQAIVAAQGDLNVAAELLHTSPHALVAALVLDENNYDQLTKYLRMFSLIKTFTLLDSLQTSVTEELTQGNLRGKDVTKAFTDTVLIVERLTNDHTTTSNINVFETAMKSLPPHVQTALQVLAGGKSDDADAA